MEKFNYYRKAWHLLGFITPIIFYFDLLKGSFGLVHASRAIIFTTIAAFLLILIVTDTLRLKNKAFGEFYWKVFGKMMKEKEKERLNGTLPYMLSNAFVVLLFPPEIAFLAIMYLLIGDPSAAFFGSKFGSYRFYNGKSLVGVVSFILSTILGGIILTYVFYQTNPQSIFALFKNGGVSITIIVTIALGSVTAGLVEFFSGHAWKGILDDNLTIPVSSAIVVAMASIYLLSASSEQILFPLGQLYSVSNP
ncbi:MAG: dolichol kinase [Spirochaetota bacterium]